MIIIGLDEAGYGAIAGPLVIAAVAYPDNAEPPVVTLENGTTLHVQDSKKIKPENITLLAAGIRATATAWELHTLSSAEVDRLGGAYRAKHYGLTLVARRIVERLHVFNGPDRQARVIIDGHVDLQLPFPFEAIPRADATIWQVSAASIVAKAEQLSRMNEAHEAYPRYAFKSNNGYPTAEHLARLQKYGPCKLHRRLTRPLAPWRKKLKGREEMDERANEKQRRESRHE